MPKEIETRPNKIPEKIPKDDKRRRIIEATFELNDDQTDFLFPTRNDILFETFSERFDEEMSDKSRVKELKRANGTYYGIISKIISAYEDFGAITIGHEKIRSMVDNTILATEGFPDSLDIEELTQVLRRKISLSKLLRKLGNSKLKSDAVTSGPEFSYSPKTFRTDQEEQAESHPQEEIIIDSGMFVDHILESNQAMRRENFLIKSGNAPRYIQKIPTGPINDRVTVINKG